MTVAGFSHRMNHGHRRFKFDFGRLTSKQNGSMDMSESDIANKMAHDFRRFKNEADAIKQLCPILAEVPEKIAIEIRQVLFDNGYDENGDPVRAEEK